MILPSLSPLFFLSNIFWVRRIFWDLMQFVCSVTFDGSFLQLLVQSVFEPMWTLSLDKNSYRSMLHEEPSPFVCSKPGSYRLCVMVPSSYIGRDRKKLLPKHLLQATHDFVDTYHSSLKLSLFQSEDSYYYSVVTHVEDVSRLSQLYCSFPVFIYPFQKKQTSTSHTDMAFSFSEWLSFSLLDSLEGICSFLMC